MSMDLETAVARHYGTAGLKERIFAGIAAAGLDSEQLKPADLSPVDEFHTGGKIETERALSKVRVAATDHVIDVGCGIGGTARYLASTKRCKVTGIDLTPEYIDIAHALTARTGLSDLLEFQVASALDMPFDDAAFDAAVTFHVAMNIKDRPALYREIARVLKPGAALCIYDVLKGARGDVLFPVPWAETAATSHLTTIDEMRRLLADAGFEIEDVEERTQFAIEFFRQRLGADPAAPPPPLGLHLLTGANSRAKFENYLRGVEAGAIAPTMIVARRV